MNPEGQQDSDPAATPAARSLVAQGWQELTPSARKYWYCSEALTTLIAGLVVIAIAVALQIILGIIWHWYIAAGLILIDLINTLIAPALRYKFHRWMLDGEVIGSRQGWLTIKQRVAPLSKVQTIDHTQGPLQRYFKVATLEITTASSAGDVTISALDFEVVEQIEIAVRAAVRDHQDGT